MNLLHHAAGVLLGLLLVCAAGCDDGGRPPAECPAPCPCADDGCAPGWCGVQVILEPSCREEAPRVEVHVAGCLEPDDLVLPADGGETAAVMCGAIAENASGEVVARGEGFQWGPFELTCPEGGGLLYPVRLACP